MISGDHSGRVADIARMEIPKWVQRRAGAQLPDHAWDGTAFELLAGGRNTMATRLRNEGSDVWSVRAEDPDKNVASRVWLNKVVIGCQGGKQPRLGARQLVTTREPELVIEPAVPGFMQQMARTCELLVDGRTLEPNPWPIDDNEQADDLIELLLDPNRTLPVFVVSMSPSSGFPLECDGAILGDAWIGSCCRD